MIIPFGAGEIEVLRGGVACPQHYQRECGARIGTSTHPVLLPSLVFPLDSRL